jgi:Heterokaryon incompatibility protein (HET)
MGNGPDLNMSYQYRPLSKGRVTRIIMLEPHPKHDAPIRIALDETLLPERGDEQEAKAYEALSYVWGAKTGQERIVCEEGALFITKSCLVALRYLRLEHEPRYLWVDAICIDQRSDSEKVRQIPLMGSVYAHANRVIAWLGSGDHGIKTLMEHGQLSADPDNDHVLLRLGV